MLLYRIRDATKELERKSISAKGQNWSGKVVAALSVFSIFSVLPVFATFEGRARSMVIGRGPMPNGNRGDSAL